MAVVFSDKWIEEKILGQQVIWKTKNNLLILNYLQWETLLLYHASQNDGRDEML